MGMGASFRSGGTHDVYARHQRRPMVSERLADRHGAALAAALRAAQARKLVDVFKRIAARDSAAGRPVSIQLADRIRIARIALADSEAALAVMKKIMSAKREAEVVDDDDCASDAGPPT